MQWDPVEIMSLISGSNTVLSKCLFPFFSIYNIKYIAFGKRITAYNYLISSAFFGALGFRLAGQWIVIVVNYNYYYRPRLSQSSGIASGTSLCLSANKITIVSGQIHLHIIPYLITVFIVAPLLPITRWHYQGWGFKWGIKKRNFA